MDGIADGFICRWSSLMPCTTLGWGCTSLAFFCSTWSHILLCVLSDEHMPPDSIPSASPTATVYDRDVSFGLQCRPDPSKKYARMACCRYRKMRCHCRR